jgi:F0F1-type ATP synthase membrane subunit c/vacuolar-type H+-ATPase subunit K
MEPSARAITWEAPEHVHQEKGGDWFLAFAIIMAALAVAAVLFGNTLFALLIGVAGGALAVSAARRPSVIPFAITVRGIRIDDRLFPYDTLRAYHIDEENENGPQLLVLSKKRFMPLLVLPLPSQYIDDVEDIMRDKLAEKFLEEPLFMKLLEKFGF